jgi:hypothetical protein
MKRLAFLLGFFAASIYFSYPPRFRKAKSEPKPIDPRILRELGAL